jgi:hypothetical protein
VRSLSLVASLAALFVSANTVSSSAGSVQPVVVNMSHPSNATPVPLQADAVPPNCVRQECGKLWCWQMKGSANTAPTTNH